VSYKADVMDELRVSLGRLGLGHHEAMLYAALLERSPASAAWLARKCGMARSSVYTALGTLADKGLVGTTHEGEARRFVAQGHSALMDLLHQEQERAATRVALGEALRGQFERLRSEKAETPQVVFFEGQEGLKRVYLSLLRQRPAELCLLRDEFLFTPPWAFVFDKPWKDRVRELKRAHPLHTRLLLNRSEEEQARGPFYRSRPQLEHRFLPVGFRLERFALYLAGDSVAVMSMEEGNLVGVQLDSPHLARNFAALFGALWEVSSA
jgi:DNA-binding MarR family transcriptional regulator